MNDTILYRIVEEQTFCAKVTRRDEERGPLVGKVRRRISCDSVGEECFW